jgi:hypothetical protein
MSLTNYYTIITGLQDLSLDTRRILVPLAEFKTTLSEFLTEEDYQLAEALLLTIDNKNILNKILKNKEEFIPNGKYSEEEINEIVAVPVDVEPYIIEFVEEAREDTSSSENQKELTLFRLYNEYLYSLGNEFLQDWASFSINLKNYLIAKNCAEYNFKAEEQLLMTEFTENVYQALVRGSFGSDIIKDELLFSEKIVSILDSEKTVVQKEHELDDLRFEVLEELTFFNYFSIEKILSYIIKVIIIERWLRMDKEQGQKAFKAIIDKLIQDTEIDINN